ncbi:hypothetical protein [Nocardioides litoris]|uniref:hypothetical protein n=1 Tax=Nocardioides litoris TaxID=1926648 RepID=UPI0011244CF9|nr:hypothetical protein [Nocardioides litoris]
MTPLGLVTLVAVALCLKDWRRRFPWLLSASLVLPISAAFVLPGLALTPFFTVALVLSALLAWDWARGRVALFSWPGAGLLVAFVTWVVLVTLAGPALFAGIPVLNNRDEAGGLVSLLPLAYTGSNVAQPAYLGLGVVVICFLATRERISTTLFLPGLLGCMSLSTWRLLHDKVGLPFPTGLTDSDQYLYVETTEYRLRGVFTEPSTLAHYGTAAFALSLVVLTIGRRRADHGAAWVPTLWVALAVCSAVNIVFARSGTALVGGLAVLAVVAGIVVVRASRSGRGLTTTSIATCLGGIVVLQSWGTIGGYVSGLFTDKVQSGSFDQRTFSDEFSLRLFLDVHGVGVGLGSNKPSSLWPMLLSCTGLVGTLLFTALVGYLVLGAARRVETLGAAVVVTSLVITKSVAGSFLSEPLLLLGLSVCAHAVAAPRWTTAPPEDPSLAPVTPARSSGSATRPSPGSAPTAA